MNELFSKIEDFLFDILGLVLPGMVFVIILMVPLLFLNDHSSTLIQPTPIIAIYNFIFVMKEKIKIQSGLSLIVFFITCYLVGHFVKVFAIIMYDFLSVIFDKILNPILNSIVTIPGKLFKWIYQKRYKTDIKLSKKYNYLLQIISPFRNTALKIFIFRPPDYFSDNSGLVTECVRIVN